MTTAATGAIVSCPAMISFAVAGLNRGSAPHARAAFDEAGTVGGGAAAEGAADRLGFDGVGSDGLGTDGFASDGLGVEGTASDGTASAMAASGAGAASEGRPVAGGVAVMTADGARRAAPPAPAPASAATAQQPAIPIASTSRLTGIRELLPGLDGPSRPGRTTPAGADTPGPIGKEFRHEGEGGWPQCRRNRVTALRRTAARPRRAKPARASPARSACPPGGGPTSR